MRTRRAARAVTLALVAALAVSASTVATPVAAADSCPDVDVVFARGTNDNPGFGPVGKLFLGALKRKLRGTSISAYAVNYPATLNFPKSTSEGALDANKHVQYVAGVCPNTKIVLGGMSQGSGVIDLITIGNRRVYLFKTYPLPDAMVNHVAAVAVFANPARGWRYLGPLTEISPQYGSKTIDLCAPNDPVCSNGNNPFAHYSYVWNGMINDAATFVAARVLSGQT